CEHSSKSKLPKSKSKGPGRDGTCVRQGRRDQRHARCISRVPGRRRRHLSTGRGERQEVLERTTAAQRSLELGTCLCRRLARGRSRLHDRSVGIPSEWSRRSAGSFWSILHHLEEAGGRRLEGRA